MESPNSYKFNLFPLALKQYYPVLITLFLLIFGYIRFIHVILFYFTFCTLHRIFFKISLSYDKSNKTLDSILSQCSSITNLNYKPPFFLPLGVLQFAFQKASKVKPKYKLISKRELIGEDGVCIDWVSSDDNPNRKGNKILIIVPGLTGGIKDTYIVNLLDRALKTDFVIGIYQMRILNENVKFPKEENIHFSLFEDFYKAMKFVKNKFGKESKIYSIGYSYGANQLVRFLGEFNNKEHLIESAVSVSNPYNFSIGSVYLEFTIYSRLILFYLQRTFKKISKAVGKDTKYKIDINKAQNTCSMREYDRQFTSKVMGYKTVDDYYREIGCAKYLKYVDIPLLIIHAKDDCITSIRAVPMDDIKNNKNIAIILSDQGNHSTFLEANGILGVRQWLVKPIVEFMEASSNTLV
ncbi:MAG: hypothetical protein MJ252_11395 [archaeon]|nr:hypothetical protein [archaeon]